MPRSTEPTPDLSAKTAVLLDLDGTLVDTSTDLAAAVNRTLADDGLEPLALAEILPMVGNGAPVLLEKVYGRRGTAPPDGTVERFRVHYARHLVVESRPYPGMVDLLRRLADRPGTDLAVVTNKPDAFADGVVDGLDLRRYVRFVLGPEAVPRRKPHPEHLLVALERLGRRPEDAVMVGDGTTDARAGRQAGVVTVAVLWGYTPREELLACEPDHVVSTVDELAALLAGT